MSNFREVGSVIFKTIFLAGVFVLAVGLVLWGTRLPRGPALILQPPPSPGPIVVHISGAVVQPGVYNLPYGARIQDGVQAAGGLAENSNPDSLNMAAILEDGQRVVVATARPIAPTALRSETDILEATAPASVSFPLDINQADAAALETLPKIGPVMAARIVTYREANGAFKTIEAIQDVPGIGPATFEAIKALITVTP